MCKYRVRTKKLGSAVKQAMKGKFSFDYGIT